MGPTPEALALADFLIAKYGLSIDRHSLAYAIMGHETAAMSAPAAAGAQGEEYPECSGDPSACPENEGHGCCKPNPKCSCPSGDGSLRWPCPVHQPAAADGGVRERARELLAVELEHDGFAETAYAVRSGWNVHQQAPALRVIEALSSHRQAGDGRPHVVRIPKEKRWVEGDSELLKWHADGYNSALSDFMSVNQGVSRLERSPDLSKFRELAEKWLAVAKESPRPRVYETYKAFADELMALVEKGAG